MDDGVLVTTDSTKASLNLYFAGLYGVSPPPAPWLISTYQLDAAKTQRGGGINTPKPWELVPDIPLE